MWTAVPAVFAVAVLGAACSRREPITSCNERLEGTWKSDRDGERWMILDRGSSLELYGLFPDGHVPGAEPKEGPGFTSGPSIETAPRVIDLTRTPSGLSGDVKRRFMQRGTSCIAKASATVTSCANDVIELVLSDPPVPAGFEPCSFPRPDSSRRERWTRE